MDFSLQKNVLVNMIQIIEVSQARGCWKPQEMKNIGTTYNSLCEILKKLEDTLNDSKLNNNEEEHNNQEVKEV